ncbi:MULTISPECIES: hypothetical protein [Nostoc]|uniref:Uncharacterized protein n=2 Tax=Nostoc TaxID=1177 RepID=A0ABR8II64_9NOSO|nr:MULTISPECIES: hypothetical protein [Nostoc]MBD2563979.1 hypothetical protein [Nostoc linckia FACHB-391]MBD2650433.1 hypothetical protein [Nostoc foliaceum FACHB-393]
MTNISVLQSLQNISTGYSVFEPNQVLNSEQLNSIANYLDDQTRLTRVKLLGVGIACGLRVSMQDDKVTVTQGVGVTTDGDLLYFNNDTVFDRFKSYDKSDLGYAPLYENGDVKGKMIPVYELVPENVNDEGASLLNKFNSQPGKSLNNMVAVLLMESYVKDDDLCSGTDCDNLGKDYINTIKLLIVEISSAGLLRPKISTPDQAFTGLSEIVANRPFFSSSINDLNQLTSQYRQACNTIYQELIPRLTTLASYSTDSSAPFYTFLKDTFSSASITTLNNINAGFQSRSGNFGIQYYYDFLKDVVETYNHFRDLLFGDTTWCCPDIKSFPKHLLLGHVLPDGNDEIRTDFYPSPILSRTAEQLNHAKFLAKKLNTLIETFQLPPTQASIRITPSLTEEHPLEERSIPYYYQVNQINPIEKSWNYRLHQRRRDAYNYSYNANEYNALGGAANPLDSQIGRFSFFRIEGHLGKNVATAINAIEELSKSKNLPFTVRSVLLGTDKTKLFKNPNIRYTDLHRLHYMLRQDMYYQLDEVAQLSASFQQAVNTGVVNDEKDAAQTKTIAADKNTNIQQKAVSARTKLNRSYSQFRADTSWKSDINDVLKTSSEFKSNMGEVARTEYSTAFDSLISNTQVLWLDWLDEIIRDKDDKEDNKIIFNNFVSQHPGIEHFAGVVRGGTFVLVYDSNNTVIADFMLPYYLPDTSEQEPNEPVLKTPDVKRPKGGVTVIPSRNYYVGSKLNEFKMQIEPQWNEKFDLQKQYFNIYQDYVKSTSSIFSNISGKQLIGTDTRKFADALLGNYLEQTNNKREKVDILKQKAQQLNLQDEIRQNFERQAQSAEIELAQSIQETTNYIAQAKLDVTTGSEGFTAMQEISNSVRKITQPEALKRLQEGLTGVKNNTTNANLNVIITNILRR